jgi:hypothetical protein
VNKKKVLSSTATVPGVTSGTLKPKYHAPQLTGGQVQSDSKDRANEMARHQFPIEATVAGDTSIDVAMALQLSGTAAMSRDALVKGNKRGGSDATWAKVKYDRQIVAIAKVHGATTIYSDDGDIATLGKRAKIEVVSLAELPLPPQKAQLDLLEHAEMSRTAGEGLGEDQTNPQ